MPPSQRSAGCGMNWKMTPMRLCLVTLMVILRLWSSLITTLATVNVRLVYREWPILGEGSTFAARAAVASRKQGRYEEVHIALMKLGRSTEATVTAARTNLGLDMDRLRIDMKSSEIDRHIALSMKLTQNLGFIGTPSFVIGDELIPGMVPLARLKEIVNEQRSNI